jgi:hypothetical protein
MRGVGSRIIGELKDYADRQRFVLILTRAGMNVLVFYNK